jgi:hypothetical protein
MTFTSSSPFVGLYFDLAPIGGLGPGVSPDCTPSPAIGYSCSIPGSPFILMTTATGTAVTLLAHGTIYDSGDGSTSDWSGQFSTQIVGETPAQIEATEEADGFVASSFAGEFNITPVPEPVSMALVGGGLLALAAIKRRKRA